MSQSAKRDNDSAVFYFVKLADTILVFRGFQKKTQKTQPAGCITTAFTGDGR